jgi:TonB family protein
MFRLLAAALFLALLAGCSTTPSTNAYKREANEALAKQGKRETREQFAPEVKEKLRRLWADHGEALDLINLSHDITPPRLLKAVAPVYPAGPHVRALVVVAAIVGEDGRVMVARTYESNNARFNQAALHAIKQWRFSPARDDGRPIKMMMLVPVEFRP